MSTSSNNTRLNLETGSGRARNSKPANNAGYDPTEIDIDKATKQLEELKRLKEAQQAEEERQTRIEGRRNEFAGHRDKVLEKLTEAIPKIDQELMVAKQEINDLEQAKKHFQSSLRSVEQIQPSQWKEEQVEEQAERYQNYLAKTAREYDQFASILAEGRGGSLQDLTTKRFTSPFGEFGSDVLRGFAFSLPLIATLIILLLNLK